MTLSMGRRRWEARDTDFYGYNVESYNPNTGLSICGRGIIMQIREDSSRRIRIWGISQTR